MTAAIGSEFGAPAQAALARLIERNLPGDGRLEVAPGIVLRRASSPSELTHGVINPSFCAIAQGSKEVWHGEDTYRYDSDSYLLTSSVLPMMWKIVEASPERPYLGVVVVLDAEAIISVLIESDSFVPPAESTRPVAVSRLDTDQIDVLSRLLRLVDKPDDYNVLAPLATRELAYRLLRGEQGDRLRQIGLAGAHGPQVGKAIQHIRTNYRDAIQVTALARIAAMGASAFHQRFKAATGTTPLQFQKQLRLYEARRLLVPGDLDAATVGRRVGYEDSSHFSRDYKRLFGEPPARDVERIRGR